MIADPSIYVIRKRGEQQKNILATIHGSLIPVKVVDIVVFYKQKRKKTPGKYI
jgi:hypothetical protein